MRRQRVATWLLHKMGWRALPLPQDFPKVSVICVAPHTSNWDFIIGQLFYWSTGRPSGFLMKKSWFFPPLGYLLRRMGGIPVDRTKKTDAVERIATYLKSQEAIGLGITPEGTRSATKHWRSGFYRIALRAEVPIQLAKINYKLREVGIFEIFYPTGDMEEDLDYIRSCYHASEAKHPSQYHEYTTP